MCKTSEGDEILPRKTKWRIRELGQRTDSGSSFRNLAGSKFMSQHIRVPETPRSFTK